MAMRPRILVSWWTVIFFGAFLLGCQAIGTHNERFYGNENSPNFRVPTDSVFVLNQELTIGRKLRRTYFQYGRVVPEHYRINRYQPWCVLRLRSKKDTAQRVKPDRFIVRSTNSRAFYEIGLLGPIKVAQRRQGHDFNYVVYGLQMELESERNPDVTTLICTRWRTRSEFYSVRIRDIRETLGDAFTLELPTKSGDLDTKISRMTNGVDH